ncbi:MAG: Arginine N-methyltransferase 2 [Trizodia sp. TS-e1964]|nr:MAG: Arginine N-methyltransferase 2 [Trizodia sp. TS-e1964]
MSRALFPEDTTKETQLLLAASHLNVEEVRNLLQVYAYPSAQEPHTGNTPLHNAIAACVASECHQPLKDEIARRVVGVDHERELQIAQEIVVDAAVKIVKLLLKCGAIWNTLNMANETPGCVARSYDLDSIYEMLVEAGVRAEMLFKRLDDNDCRLAAAESDGDEESDLDDESSDDGESRRPQPPAATGDNGSDGLQEVSDDTASPAPAAIVFNGSVPNSVPGPNSVLTPSRKTVSTGRFLSSELTFGEDRILDADLNGVMMAWESNIMKITAKILLPKPGLRVLNIGHGMGIIDDFFQSHLPSSHHIVEAHPSIIQRLCRNGWLERESVHIHTGRWQDVLPEMVKEGVKFDAIYFDTFGEDYMALRFFFSHYVADLLDADTKHEYGLGGRWSFFNGLGADRQICYDVYTRVVEMDLFASRFDTEWQTVSIPNLEMSREWDGVSHKYWALEEYRLPICRYRQLPNVQ